MYQGERINEDSISISSGSKQIWFPYSATTNLVVKTIKPSNVNNFNVLNINGTKYFCYKENLTKLIASRVNNIKIEHVSSKTEVVSSNYTDSYSDVAKKDVMKNVISDALSKLKTSNIYANELIETIDNYDIGDVYHDYYNIIWERTFRIEIEGGYATVWCKIQRWTAVVYWWEYYECEITFNYADV